MTPTSKLLLAAVFGFLSLTVQAQVTTSTAKSYFIPADSVNQSIFDCPGDDGEPSAFNTVIWYILKPQGYEVTTKKTMETKTMSMHSESLTFTPTEVKMTRKRSVNLMGSETDKTFKIPQTVLKVPAIGQKAYWSNTEASGDVFKCTAELAAVIIDGKTIPAVKVIKQGFEDGGKTLVSWANTTEYYVQGIGLYKIKYKNGKTMELLHEQSFQMLDE